MGGLKNVFAFLERLEEKVVRSFYLVMIILASQVDRQIHKHMDSLIDRYVERLID